ncbi:MAG: hypothetical protein FWF49_03605, partial [Oscillospiraceae bacterium]|nr:hypothetical protein [Oscillospiraceae bacterium]
MEQKSHTSKRFVAVLSCLVLTLTLWSGIVALPASAATDWSGWTYDAAGWSVSGDTNQTTTLSNRAVSPVYSINTQGPFDISFDMVFYNGVTAGQQDMYVDIPGVVGFWITRNYNADAFLVQNLTDLTGVMPAVTLGWYYSGSNVLTVSFTRATVSASPVLTLTDGNGAVLLSYSLAGGYGNFSGFSRMAIQECYNAVYLGLKNVIVSVSQPDASAWNVPTALSAFNSVNGAPDSLAVDTYGLDVNSLYSAWDNTPLPATYRVTFSMDMQKGYRSSATATAALTFGDANKAAMATLFTDCIPDYSPQRMMYAGYWSANNAWFAVPNGPINVELLKANPNDPTTVTYTAPDGTVLATGTVNAPAATTLAFGAVGGDIQYTNVKIGLAVPAVVPGWIPGYQACWSGSGSQIWATSAVNAQLPYAAPVLTGQTAWTVQVPVSGLNDNETVGVGLINSTGGEKFVTLTRAPGGTGVLGGVIANDSYNNIPLPSSGNVCLEITRPDNRNVVLVAVKADNGEGSQILGYAYMDLTGLDINSITTPSLYANGTFVFSPVLITADPQPTAAYQPFVLSDPAQWSNLISTGGTFGITANPTSTNAVTAQFVDQHVGGNSWSGTVGMNVPTASIGGTPTVSVVLMTAGNTQSVYSRCMFSGDSVYVGVQVYNNGVWSATFVNQWFAMNGAAKVTVSYARQPNGDVLVCFWADNTLLTTYNLAYVSYGTLIDKTSGLMLVAENGTQVTFTGVSAQQAAPAAYDYSAAADQAMQILNTAFIDQSAGIIKPTWWGFPDPADRPGTIPAGVKASPWERYEMYVVIDNYIDLLNQNPAANAAKIQQYTAYLRNEAAYAVNTGNFNPTDVMTAGSVFNTASDDCSWDIMWLLLLCKYATPAQESTLLGYAKGLYGSVWSNYYNNSDGTIWYRMDGTFRKQYYSLCTVAFAYCGLQISALDPSAPNYAIQARSIYDWL